MRGVVQFSKRIRKFLKPAIDTLNCDIVICIKESKKFNHTSDVYVTNLQEFKIYEKNIDKGNEQYINSMGIPDEVWKKIMCKHNDDDDDPDNLIQKIPEKIKRPQCTEELFSNFQIDSNLYRLFPVLGNILYSKNKSSEDSDGIKI